MGEPGPEIERVGPLGAVLMNWIAQLFGVKKRKKRAPDKLPSELTAEEKAYRAVRAARARAKRKARRG